MGLILPMSKKDDRSVNSFPLKDIFYFVQIDDEYD